MPKTVHLLRTDLHVLIWALRAFIAAASPYYEDEKIARLEYLLQMFEKELSDDPN